jgi:Reverse transcriptase (RNA-dependent DNA polymerase)
VVTTVSPRSTRSDGAVVAAVPSSRRSREGPTKAVASSAAVAVATSGSAAAVVASVAEGVVAAAAPSASDFRAAQLHKFVGAWEAWGAPEHILRFVRGHRLRLISRPPLLGPAQFSSHAVRPSPKVLVAVQKLEDMGAVLRVPPSPSFLSDLFVLKQRDKDRPIFNCANFNVHLKPPPFHLPNIRHFQSLLSPGAWMYSVDIQNAYLNCRLHPDSRRFLRFFLNGQLFEWQTLAFGVSTIPHDFQQVTAWIAQKMRQLGLDLIIYIDDFGGAAAQREVAAAHAQQLVDRLRSLGFPVSPKSQIEPVQHMKLLGMEFHTVANTLTLPPDKQKKLQLCMQHFLNEKAWTLKQCQSLCGSLNFAALAVPLGTLHSRLIQREMRNFKRRQPQLRIPIPDSVQAEFVWWQSHLHLSLPLFRPPASVFIATDASDEGYGATVNGSPLSGLWTARQRRWHINRRELWVLLRILQSSAAEWEEQTILMQSDNMTAVACLNRQGTTKSLLLLETAMDILTLAEQHKIHLAAFYLPGRYMLAPDALSRPRLALPEWHLDPACCRLLCSEFGQPTLDLFASHRSAQCQRSVVFLVFAVDVRVGFDTQNVFVVLFVCARFTARVCVRVALHHSLHLCRYVSFDCRDHGAEWVDAFSRPWHGEVFWVFPPPTEIPRVLKQLKSASGQFYLVLPMWDSAWWTAQLVALALGPPHPIAALESHLVDLATGVPPPSVEDIQLAVWTVCLKPASTTDCNRRCAR